MNLKSFCGKRDAIDCAVDRQSKDPGSNPGTVESVSFSTERFQSLQICMKAFPCLILLNNLRMSVRDIR